MTRDQLFGESAARALKAFSSFAVVVVDLPQQRWPAYQEQFLAALLGPKRPIMPCAFLGSQGMKKSDLSKFIEETVRDTREAFADVSPDQLQKMLDEVVEDVRVTRR